MGWDVRRRNLKSREAAKERPLSHRSHAANRMPAAQHEALCLLYSSKPGVSLLDEGFLVSPERTVSNINVNDGRRLGYPTCDALC